MRFAVVGDPVEHSRSPAIHNAAFRAYGIEAEFDFMHVPRDQFSEVVEALRSGEVAGVSVTMPHKHNAYDAAEHRSVSARRTGAVNTLVMSDGQLAGHNTDVAGIRHALGHVESGATRPVLLLGYGGAAAAALLAVEGRTVYISGRDPARAHKLVDRVGIDAEVLEWGTPVQMATVINATPLGMNGEFLPDGVVERCGALVDMTYGETRSPALMDALALGFPTADGLTMLVGQAAQAFEIFTGTKAPLAIMEMAARI